MEGLSRLIDGAARYAQDVERRAALRPADPWPESERGETQRRNRVRRATRDFWEFDRLYFPPELYKGDYAPPCDMHRDMVTFALTPGVHVVCGPRNHGKTVTAKKVFVWLQLTGRADISGTYSSTLPTARNILDDLSRLIKDNPRIVEDFGVEFLEDNDEQYTMRVAGRREYVHCAAFSEGRSVRGYARLFSRPDRILADDVETKESPLQPDQVEERIAKISEAYLSLSASGTFLWNANNFDERCATNRLLKEQEAGILPENWHIHVYDVWNETTSLPLWYARFPVTTEAALRVLCRPRDDSDWWGNFRQRPRKPEGFIFKRQHLQLFDHLPDDAELLGLIYFDPNLSLKEKGDTTSIIQIFFSPKTGCLYINDVRCKSYADSNLLLTNAVDFWIDNVYLIGYDGHVSQEAMWTQHMFNWSVLNARPFPNAIPCRYNVDAAAQFAQTLWESHKILYNRRLVGTEEGDRFIEQVIAFAGKKANKKDDAPDSLICAIRLMMDRGFIRIVEEERGDAGDDPAFSAANYYQRGL